MDPDKVEGWGNGVVALVTALGTAIATIMGVVGAAWYKIRQLRSTADGRSKKSKQAEVEWLMEKVREHSDEVKAKLDAQIASMRGEMDDLEKRLEESKEEHIKCRLDRMADQERIRFLERDNEDLRGRVKRLEEGR